MERAFYSRGETWWEELARSSVPHVISSRNRNKKFSRHIMPFLESSFNILAFCSRASVLLWIMHTVCSGQFGAFWTASGQVDYWFFFCELGNVLQLFEPPHVKTNKVTVRPAKTQISLGIRLVWSESSLCAQWVAKDPSFLHADHEDSDQTGRMPRLIWVFVGRTATLLVLSWGGSCLLPPYSSALMGMCVFTYCLFVSPNSVSHV